MVNGSAFKRGALLMAAWTACSTFIYSSAVESPSNGGVFEWDTNWILDQYPREQGIESAFLATVEEQAAASPTSCNVSASEPCSITTLPKDQRSFVYTGANTTCLYGTPYYFVYYPGYIAEDGSGPGNNVLIAFQGGGACFIDGVTSVPGTCSQQATQGFVTATQQAKPDLPSGIFNQTPGAEAFNPYYNWSIVSVLYCSGDLFVGNTTKTYPLANATSPDEKEIVYQSGFSNTLATLNWVYSNFPKPSKLVVSGASAGALGAQIWSDHIFNHYGSDLHGDQKAVILDSYGLPSFPPSSATALKEFGVCEALDSIGFWTNATDLLQECQGETLWAPRLLSLVQGRWPDVPFVALQSKFDVVQVTFYQGLGLLGSLGLSNASYNLPDGVVVPDASAGLSFTGPDLYNQSIVVADYLHSQNKNFLVYILNSTNHVYTVRPLFATAKIAPRLGCNAPPPTLADYVKTFPLEEGEVVQSFCDDNPQYPCPTSLKWKYQQPVGSGRTQRRLMAELERKRKR